VYLSPEELDYPYRTVLIPTPVGPAPAWLIPAEQESGAWVIQVHGRGVTRAETLRAVPVFREAGYTSLVVSYRNDGDAPRSVDGRYALGDSEWRDIEAAIRYAQDAGATRIVLMGWSMGGATVLQVLHQSPLASAISGVVLDSPVVDWTAALSYQADSYRLPAPLRSGALAMISNGWGRAVTGQKEAISLERLNVLTWAGDLTTPILILHSDDDGFIPSGASRELAALRPDIVTFVPFETAGHTKLWNYDPEHWNSAINGWLLDPDVAER
jgi:alpha-beta hydrolase superfamily lysophospholipase